MIRFAYESCPDLCADVAQGNAEVFYSDYSLVPGSTRKRNLVDLDSLTGLITGIINDKAIEIAAGVDGVEGIVAGEEVVEPKSGGYGRAIAKAQRFVPQLEHDCFLTVFSHHEKHIT